MKRQLLIPTLLSLLLLVFAAGIFFIASKISENKNEGLYDYVPEEANLILQINSQEIIKEGAYRLFFDQNDLEFIEEISLDGKRTPSAINPEIAPIVFTELWEGKLAAFCVFGIHHENTFRNKCEKWVEEKKIVAFSSNAEIGVVCMKGEKIETIQNHLDHIAEKNINEISDRFQLIEKFDAKALLNGYIEKVNLNNASFIEQNVIQLDHEAGNQLTVKYQANGKIDPKDDFDVYALTPKNFHSTFLIPSDLNRNDSLPKVKSVSINYGGTKINGLMNVNLNLELYLSTDPKKFKEFLFKIFDKNGIEHTNNNKVDTITWMNTHLLMREEGNGILLYGKDNEPELIKQEDVALVRIKGSPEYLSTIEGNTSILNVMLQSFAKIQIEQIQAWTKNIRTIEGEIMIEQNGAQGELHLQMKDGKDFFKESLRLISNNQPKETQSDDGSAATDGE